MIEFSLSESDALISDTVSRFAADHLAPNARTFEADRSVSPDVRGEWEKLGLAGLEIPEALGGAACGSLTLCLVNEALGAADPGAALDLDSLGAARYPMLEMATAAELQQVMEGGVTNLIYAPQTDIIIEDQRCSGTIAWTHRDKADQLVFLDSDKAWLIREGFSLEPVRGSGLRAAGGSRIHLEKAPVSSIWHHPEGAKKSLARARLYYGSLLLGLLDQTASYSRHYAMERRVFGKPVAHHQAMAFLMTDMNTLVNGCRLQLHYAASLGDEADSTLFCEAAATAWAEICEAAASIGPNGVQILGGVGFMQDYPVEKYMREARALSLLLGGQDAARDDASQLLIPENSQVELVRGLM